MKSAIGLFLGVCFTVGLPADAPEVPAVNTFSIVARDPEAKEWGVAVASRVLAVGAVVPYAKVGVGAVATQSSANVTYGPRGLEMMALGLSAQKTLDALLESDPGKESRQVGIIDAEGRVANFTGAKCNPWAGAKSGTNYSCQGNLLTGPEVIDAMAEAFEKAKGPLAWRLALALEAGEKAGGDKRGKQSAGLLVVRDKGGWGGFNDRYVDLRVDDHDAPVTELLRVLGKRVKK
jgi:uncharacterized Ntn-hydrolase superfamily protein